MRHLDPQFRIIQADGGPRLQTRPYITVASEAAVGSYICPAVPVDPYEAGHQKRRWWIPTSSADPLYKKTKVFARARANALIQPHIKRFWDDARQRLESEYESGSLRHQFAGMVSRHSPFQLQVIMQAPRNRLHRQALARALTGDLMIGRITKHFFLSAEERIPGLPQGCVACYRASASQPRVCEDEEHLLFDCCSTSRLRPRLWSALTEDEARRVHHAPPGSRLEVLITINRLTLWDTLGELFFRIWSRPQQAWCHFRAKEKRQHTDTV